MNAVNSGSFSFEISATNLNLADTVDQTIWTFPSSDVLVRIPTLLELKKAAGTAYTLVAPVAPAALTVNNADRISFTVPPLASYSDRFAGGRFLYILNNLGVVFFAIPLVGFLDSTAVESRIALPNTGGGVFRPGTGDRTFVIRTSVGVSLGTGSLLGRMHFDEYAVNG